MQGQPTGRARHKERRTSRARIILTTVGAARTAAAGVARTRRRLRREAEYLSHPTAPVEARQSITVNRPPDDVYRLWRDLAGLPRFMRHLESVEVLDARRSRWSVRGPGGAPVSWEAEITEDRDGELIAWRSMGSSDVATHGRVAFKPAPAGHGTEVRVELAYRAPGGRAGRNLARLFRQAPDQQVRDELRAMKQVIETGDVVVSDATLKPGRHPAQPSREAGRTS